MSNAGTVTRRLKVIRVVTASYVVPWHLANTLKRIAADFDVTVVGQGVSAYRDSYPGIRWIDLDLNRKVSLLSDLCALFSLCRIFLAIKPDIVHSIMPKAGLISALAGFLCRVPVRMHTFTGQVWATQRGLKRELYRMVDRLIVLLDTLCMTDSPSQSQFLLEQGITASGLPLPVLSCGSLSGVDTGRFHPDAQVRARVRAAMGIPHDAVVFLYLGRLSRDKGILDLAAAFAMLQDEGTHLILAGPDEEGVLEKVLSRLVACCARVHITGFARQPEHMFMAADVFCLPSRREGFGSVVIEAAACGIPAIGTRIPGLVDAIVDGVTGRLCAVNDIGALTACMEEMLQNPGQRSKMGEQARNRAVRLFDADVLYQALRDCYFNIASTTLGEGKL